MKKVFKSAITIMLAMVFLLILPLSASAESVQATINYNADYFLKPGVAMQAVTKPEFAYDGALMPTDKVSIIGEYGTYDFSFAAATMVQKSLDVLAMTSSAQTVTLSGNPAKYIGIIVNGVSQSADVTFTVTQKDGTPKTFIKNVKSRFEEPSATYAYEYGNTLKKGTSTLIQYSAGGAKAYLHLIELAPDTINELESITFPYKEGFDYHVIGVVEIPYSASELEDMKNQALQQDLPIYKAKTLTDIVDSDLERLKLLVDAIGSAHEDYEYINNLYIGYPLYKAQKALYNEYSDIMTTRNYIEATASDIFENQSEAENLDKLIALYDTQAQSDKGALEAILTYFSISENIFVDEAEKETIAALKADYLILKEQKDLENEIASIYDTYKDKTAADLTDTDITELDKLLSAYDKADEIGVAYNADEKAYIEKIKDDFVRYATSENNVHYDLSAHFNKAFVADEGATLPSDWGVNDSFKVDTDLDGTQESIFNVGMTSTIWKVAQDSNGVVKATNNVNYRADEPKSVPLLEYDSKTNDGNTFYLSQNILPTDKNVISLQDAGTSGVIVSINGSGRMAASFDLLTVGGNNNGPRNMTLQLKFTDGTVYDQKIYVPWAGWGTQGVSGMTDSNKPYNKNGVARYMSNLVTPGDYEEGKSVHNGSSWVTRAYSVPVEAGKIIESVTMSGNAVILAISERVITNEKYEELLTAQYNKVKDYDETTFDDNEVAILSAYISEGEKRGIDVSKIVDTSITDSLLAKVLTAENKFEKTDMDTVKSIISFSNPVALADVKANLAVTADGNEASYTVSMTDDKTAVVEIDDKAFGGVAYKVAVSDKLPLRDYPTSLISKAYEFLYTSPAYLEASLNEATLTVKNNTKTPYSYVAVATSISDDNTIIYGNDTFATTVNPLDENTHSLSSVSDDFFASIWDDNQKLILNVAGGAETSEAATVATADYMYPTLDFKTNELKIAGISPSKEKDKNITLDILKSGASFMKKEEKTNKDGYFEIVIPLNEYLIPSGSMLSFTLGGDDFSNKVSLNDVYFSVTDERKGIVETLSKPETTASEVSTLLRATTTKDILALDKLIYEGIDLDLAASSVHANKSLFSVSDITASRDNLRRLLILAAFNQGKKDLVSKDGFFLYEEVMNYTSEINKSGSTIYDLYNTAVNADGRSATVASLLNKNIATLSALYDLMAENMVINALEYPNVSGVGYVSDVLTNQNASRAGLSIENYFAFADKSGVNNAVASEAITSKTILENTINNYYTQYFYNQGASGSSGSSGFSGGTSGGFSSGSSSVGTFGVDQPYIDNLINNGGTVFKDVPKTHWAYSYITKLYDDKILSGKGNGAFAPDDSLTRAELVKIIVTAKGLTSKDGVLPFNDVSADSWYAPFVKTAYDNGIINGVTETSFAPNEKVSRQDLCVVLYRLLSDKRAGEINFIDADTIAPYALDAVKCFVNMGIINGFEDGSFRADEGCTRAQCAKIISMFLNK